MKNSIGLFILKTERGKGRNESDMKSYREGDVYKRINMGGQTFEIRYGYYSDSERELGEPIPILPDFLSMPQYDTNGRPYVTYIQDPCEHYETGDGRAGDGWCADCIHYPDKSIEIGICKCRKNIYAGFAVPAQKEDQK